MAIILFQPFHPAKWFLIAFNVFLALLAEGGFSVNNPFGGTGQSYTYRQQPFDLMGIEIREAKNWLTWFRELPGNSWLLFWIAAGVLYVMVWLFVNWVGCRAQFMLLDNIVRNRAALAEPWRRYAHQGNVWFPVRVSLSFISTLIFFALGGGFVALNWSWINAERYPVGLETLSLMASLLVWLVAWTILTSLYFLIRSFVLPLYFKQTMGLGAAMLAVARLIATHPGSVFVYLLLSLFFAIATAIFMAFVFCLLCCCICWLIYLPVFGTMSLSFILCQLCLPLLIFFRCFQLDCLAQFGPEFDVWIADLPPVTPPPPRG